MIIVSKPTLVFILGLGLLPSTTNAFQRQDCLEKVQLMLNQTNDTVNYVRSQLFKIGAPNVTIPGSNGTFKRQYFLKISDINDTHPVLTPEGCQALCASSRWYPDIPQRLVVWLLPVILLIGNIYLSHLDRRRYSEIIRFFGDPLDGIWSLLSKAESWRDCRELALEKHHLIPGLGEQELGTILAAIAEIAGPRCDPFELLAALLQGRPGSDTIINIRDHQLKFLVSTAHEIVDNRTEDIGRTVFSVVLYILQLLAAFLIILGGGIKGNGSPPGGRIATAMLLTYLITVVLLSNAVGGFTTRRSCFRIVRNLVEYFPPAAPPKGDSAQGESESTADHEALRHLLLDPSTFFKAQWWNEGTYSYRPYKVTKFAKKNTWRPYIVLVLSFSPILISSLAASIILWLSPPKGFNCRGAMVVAITLFWMFSALLTWFTWVTKLARDRAHWAFVIVKDITIGVPILVIILLSCSGYFNTCKCWGAGLSLKEKACIPLNWQAEYQRMNDTVYPGIAGACVGLQALIFIAMLAFEWRGIRLMKWCEFKRQSELGGDGFWIHLHIKEFLLYIKKILQSFGKSKQKD